MDNSKIWFEFIKDQEHKMRKDVIFVDHCNFQDFKSEINETIDLFNKFINYPEMWDITDAKDRVDKGHHLFLFRSENKPLGHVWMDTNYIYNLYICNGRDYVPKDRDKHLSVKLFKHCVNFMGYDQVYGQIDNWNYRSLSFAKRVGAVQVDEPTNIKTKNY